MSINILLGPPGGGKSYEAVAFHVLPALQRGRKVITNLSIDADYMDLVVPGSRDLLEIRTKTLAQKPDPVVKSVFGVERDLSGSDRWIDKPFAHIEDYADDWRDENGRGPMYVIDECHFVLPYGKTDIEVEEWYSMHRHYNVDVLLMTQSYGKCSKAIIDLVQVCYKVRKATAFGKNDGYIRKVLDGVRGGEISVTQRKYDKKYFPLYRSHTHGTALTEVAPDDVSPFLVKFNRFKWAWLICSLLFLVWSFWPADDELVDPDSSSVGTDSRKSFPGALEAIRAVAASEPLPAASQPSASESALGAGTSAASPPVAVRDPLADRGVHMTGELSMGLRRLITFVVSSEGRRIFATDSEQLASAGYQVVYLAPCLSELVYAGHSRFVTCDAPYQQGNGNSDHPIVIDTGTGGRSDGRRPYVMDGPAMPPDAFGPWVDRPGSGDHAGQYTTLQGVASSYRTSAGRVDPRPW